MKTKIFIACEIVHAEPMTELDYVKNVKKEKPDRLQKLLLRDEGYKVSYSDHLVTWMPKEFFEGFFRPLSAAEEKTIIENVISRHDRQPV